MNRSSGKAILTLLVLAASALAAPDDERPAFKQVQEGHRWSFPRDYGAHRDYSTEWWYLTGHLRAEDGRQFGFELVFFRVGISPQVTTKSAWRSDSLYLTHAALTADDSKSFLYTERRSRGAFEDAGASDATLDVWNGPFRMKREGTRIRATAADDKLSFDLDLEAVKPPVFHGRDGFSRKGPGEGEASHYYSLTRLKGSGSLTMGAESLRVADATAWLDHEVTSSGLAHGTLGWDWFAIQLDDGRELMLYQLKDAKGELTKFSSGTYVSVTGESRVIDAKAFTVHPTGWWTSPRSGIRYPSGWHVTVPEEGLTLDVTPTVRDQELATPETTGVTYWEGRCTVAGTERGRVLSGNAYVELVGWGKKS